MTTVVIDASALGALMFFEPSAAGIEDAIRGHDLVAPRLLRFEIVSIALRKYRRFPDQRSACHRAVARFPALGIREVDVAAVATMQAALEFDLSAYDASYLALSRMLQAPLLTLDRKLAAAAWPLAIVIPQR